LILSFLVSAFVAFDVIREFGLTYRYNDFIDYLIPSIFLLILVLLCVFFIKIRPAK